MMMTREELGERLLALPAAIREAEGELLDFEQELGAAQRKLTDRESKILLSDAPMLTGKNAETRAAQLREHCIGYLMDVDEQKLAVELQRIALRFLQNEFNALRACARLLRGATE